MLWVLIGLGVLAAVVMAGRRGSTMPPMDLARTVALGLAIGLGGVGLLLLLTGKLGGALGALTGAGLAYMRYRGLVMGLWRLFGRKSVPTAPARTTMTINDAYNVLGLTPGADGDAIKAAHRRLIQQVHPDQGGSDYLAAQINQARDLLLRHITPSV